MHPDFGAGLRCGLERLANTGIADVVGNVSVVCTLVKETLRSREIRRPAAVLRMPHTPVVKPIVRIRVAPLHDGAEKTHCAPCRRRSSCAEGTLHPQPGFATAE